VSTKLGQVHGELEHVRFAEDRLGASGEGRLRDVGGRALGLCRWDGGRPSKVQVIRAGGLLGTAQNYL